MPAPALYVLFFLSGISGLIYQVVWVRAFGNVFGNTMYSASLVIALFMLGLGAGAYLVGRWADHRYTHSPEALLRVYGLIELAVAAIGLAISLILPHLTTVAAAVSSYRADELGWFVLSPVSYVARGVIAFVLLGPITMLMGGTLTLLIRYRVRADVTIASGRKIAALYAVNTAGAAAGAFLTDFALVPAAGLLTTQLIAVFLNVVAGIGALGLMGRLEASGGMPARLQEIPGTHTTRDNSVLWTALALALSGFAAMGLEILWLRHMTLLLGGFRSVFALLLTVVLLAIAAGALLGGILDARTHRPARALTLVQAVFVVFVLIGLRTTSLQALAADAENIDGLLPSLTPFAQWRAEIWYNLWPILIEAGLPALLMGCAFPLANAVIQRTESVVGRRAGLLYLANTAGAVGGSLLTGFVLLPALGIQWSATVLTTAAAFVIVPLFVGSLRERGRGALVTASTAGVMSLGALAMWVTLPADYVLRRSVVPQVPGERVLAMREGVNELIAVTEAPRRGRGLLTNGHAMSSTAQLDQRYMRALAHVPLLSMDQPARVLVIGFGVGNTVHAATLHPSVVQVDVVDLSRDILEHAGYFRDANHDVLLQDRVRVFVNDGRLHLQMQPESTYDLVTLEPPPIAHAGVAALYSREFYGVVRSRLKPGGYLSQWLPAYQVPAETSLAMARAFVDVFPDSVLLSGTQAELLLVGTKGSAIQIDPEHVAAGLRQAPAVQTDLRRVDLGTVTEIIGTFVGSEATLRAATRTASAVTDDRPLQEYAVRSIVGSGVRGVPAALFDVGAIADWCPRCIDGDAPAPSVPGLDTYLALLDHAYRARRALTTADTEQAGHRRILGSDYLTAVLPDTEPVRAIIGEASYEMGSAALDRRAYAEAADHFRAALEALPESATVHNNLGVALASMGQIDQAAVHFRRAVALEPAFDEARNNLAMTNIDR
jgi:predicted membrane-bound spermidine synthase